MSTNIPGLEPQANDPGESCCPALVEDETSEEGGKVPAEGLLAGKTNAVGGCSRRTTLQLNRLSKL